MHAFLFRHYFYLAMNRLIFSIICIGLVCVGLGFYSSFQYGKQKQLVEEEIEQILQTAISGDLKIRLDKSGLEYSCYSSNYLSDKNRGKGFRVNGRDSLIPYDTVTYKEAFDKKIERAFQNILTTRYPITPYGVDSIFGKELEKNKIAGKTNICVQFNNVETFCKKEERIDPGYFCTPLLYVDLEQLIGVQGFVKMSSWTVWRRMYLDLIFVGGILFLSILAFGGLVQWGKQGKNSLKRTVPDGKGERLARQEPVAELGNGTYRIGGAVFDPLSGRLQVLEDKREVALTPQLIKLLELFITAPDYSLKISEIAAHLWPDVQEWDLNDQGKQVMKVVSKLRGEIKKILEVEIEKRRRIYSLKVNNESEPITRPFQGNGIPRIEM